MYCIYRKRKKKRCATMLILSIIINLITFTFAIISLKSYKNIKQRNQMLEIKLKYREKIIDLLKLDTKNEGATK